MDIITVVQIGSAVLAGIVTSLIYNVKKKDLQLKVCVKMLTTCQESMKLLLPLLEFIVQAERESKNVPAEKTE